MTSFLNKSVFLFLCTCILEYDPRKIYMLLYSMQFEEISRKRGRMGTQKLFQHIVPCLAKNKCSLNPHFFQTHVIIITSQKLNKCNGKKMFHPRIWIFNADLVNGQSHKRFFSLQNSQILVRNSICKDLLT